MVGTALSIAGPIVGGLISSNGAQSAANTESNAANQADATQLQMFNQQRTDKLPYLGAGTSANDQLAYLMGITPNDPNAGPNETAAQTAAFNPTAGVNPAVGASGSLAKPFSAADFTADPGYQFSMDQGMQALQRSAAAKGGLMSGAALKDLSTYAQGTAAQEYQSVYDRYNTNQNNLYSRLSGLSNSGQNMANTSGQAGTTTANEIGNNITSAGSAQAAGQVATANAWNTGLGQAYMNMNNSSGGYSAPQVMNSGFNGTGNAGPIIWN